MRGCIVKYLVCGLLLCLNICFCAHVFAEMRTIEADGVYQMGDGMAENQNIAKERARVDAVRNASERAAVYLESTTEVSEGKITKDDVRLLTASVLEVKEVKYTPVVVGESIQFCCHVVAVVDTDMVREKIQEDNIFLKTSLKKYEEENERLRREMENLKQQYQNASPAQKEEIYTQVQENDIEFEANQFFDKGVSCYRKKDYLGAIEYFEKAIKLRPTYDGPYYNLGVTYSQLGNHEKSIENYEKAISVNPKFADAYYNLGAQYLAINQRKKANDCFVKAALLRIEQRDEKHDI